MSATSRKQLLTWHSKDGLTAHQIDHIPARSRLASSVEGCAFRCAAIGDINFLVCPLFRFHLCTPPREMLLTDEFSVENVHNGDKKRLGKN